LCNSVVDVVPAALRKNAVKADADDEQGVFGDLALTVQLPVPAPASLVPRLADYVRQQVQNAPRREGPQHPLEVLLCPVFCHHLSPPCGVRQYPTGPHVQFPRL
jgi:hypothetical protein